MGSIKTGITRKRRKKIRESEKVLGWDYFDRKGKRITNLQIIDRCNKLVIPPAWEDVWISHDPKSDLQATGKDAKGRLQYRYHASWTEFRSAEKFEDLYHIRVGNDEYARKNNSYGLTTLKEGHMRIDRSKTAEGELDAILEFRGKSGKDWNIRIWEDDLAILIDESGKVGGRHKSQDLFRYEDSTGKDFDIKSYHINEYLDSLVPSDKKVTAKDFRTWAATWKAASRLSLQIDPDTITARKKVATQVIKTVASDLGNTVAVCRSSYIHPVVLGDWHEGMFRPKWNSSGKARKVQGLSKDETVVLRYLDHS
jgi:DNA topoisomerase-1